MVEMTLNGQILYLEANLRVAYQLQNQENHKPYQEILQSVDTMPLEKQVGILYQAYKVGLHSNSEPMKFEVFFDSFLEEYKVVHLMEFIKKIISGILGKEIKDKSEEETEEVSEGQDSVGEQ